MHNIIKQIIREIDRRPLAAVGLLFALIALFRIPFLLSGLEKKTPEKGYTKMTGTLLGIAEKENSRQLILKCENKSRILVYVQKDVTKLKIGNRIQVSGVFRPFSPPGNPGQFDQKTYYAVRHITGSMVAKNCVVEEETVYPILEGLRKGRILAGEVLDQICGQEAGLIKAMVIGEKTDLDAETKTLFQQNGIAHILAISGLHITLIGQSLYEAVKRIFSRGFAGRGRKSAAFISCFLMLVYILFTGAAASAVRAGLFFAFLVWADALGRGNDAASVWCFSIGIMGTMNPLYFLDAGFLLSFSALFSFLFSKELTDLRIRRQHFGPERIRLELSDEKEAKISPQKGAKARKFQLWAYRRRYRYHSLPGWLRSFLEGLRNDFLSSVILQLVMLPFLLRFFYYVPPYGIFLNLLVIPGMSIVMTTSLIGFGAGLISIFAGRIALYPARCLLLFYETLCLFIQKLPLALICAGKPDGRRMIAYYLLLLLAYVLIRRAFKKIKRDGKSPVFGVLSYMPGLLLVILAVFLLFPAKEEKLRITVQDIGQGDSIFFETPKGHTFLVDGGSTDIKNAGTYRLVPFLHSKGILRLDYVFLTHMDEDHINAVREVLEKKAEGDNSLTIEHLVMTRQALLDDVSKDWRSLCERAGVTLLVIGREDPAITAGGLTIRCLYPDDAALSSDSNQLSSVFLLSYGEFRMLLTGDLEGEGEERLTAFLQAENITADVLKVGHHGSKNATSSEFLAALQPKTAVVSVGADNRYGHPAKETLDRLKKQDIEVYRTDEDGAVSITTDGKTYAVERYRKREK